MPATLTSFARMRVQLHLLSVLVIGPAPPRPGQRAHIVKCWHGDDNVRLRP